MSDYGFPSAVRGYERQAVDKQIETLEQNLATALSQVSDLDNRVSALNAELSEANRQLREAERPSYSGLGARIEQLMRSAEEQSMDVLNQARSQ